MEAGRYRCHSLETGTLTLDGASMFQSAPPAAWKRSFPVDEEGRMTFVVRCLLLQSRDAMIVVDTGCGGTLPAQLAETYGVDRSTASLESSLAALGAAPGTITHVVLTHLHFDHAGGVTASRGGEPRLAFPEAEHFLQRDQLKSARSPRPEEKEAFIAEDVELLARSNRLRLLDGPGEILPGLEVGTADGHTTGQQYVVVRDDTMPLLFAADVIPTAAHLQFPWFTAYDLDGRLAVREKQSLLARATEEHHLVIFDHEPRFAACTVEREGRAFRPGRIVETV